MSAPQVADLLGILAIAGLLTAVAAVAAGTSPRLRPHVRGLVDEHAQVSVAILGVIAVAASLWFSEVAGFTPCRLCWYQRLAIYPLAVMAVVRAIAGGSLVLRRVAIGLGFTGLGINLWHVLIETFPTLESGSCSADVPCTLRWVEGLGVFTIPRLATVVLVLSLLLLLADRSDPVEGAEASADAQGADPTAADPTAAHPPAAPPADDPRGART